jgi:hypothetical protein
MFDRPEHVLVMVDGELPSIVAAANAREATSRAAGKPRGAVLWPALDPSDPRQDSVLALSTALGLPLLPRRSVSVGLDPAAASPSRTLIDACTDAAADGRSEVIWPVKFPPGAHADAVPDLGLISRAVDRALLVSRLMALDAGLHGQPSLHVEVPYVDLTDRQVADLAVDLAAPVHRAWWWEGDSVEALAARDRWLPTLQAAGYRAPARAR